MHYNETEAIVSVSDCQYIEAFVYPDDDRYCFTMERDRDFEHLLQKIYPIPHKKMTACGREICMQQLGLYYNSTQTWYIFCCR